MPNTDKMLCAVCMFVERPTASKSVFYSEIFKICVICFEKKTVEDL